MKVIYKGLGSQIWCVVLQYFLNCNRQNNRNHTEVERGKSRSRAKGAKADLRFLSMLVAIQQC